VCTPRHFSLIEGVEEKKIVEREREKVKHGVKDGREKWEVVWVV
jgi:hypothetical protein